MNSNLDTTIELLRDLGSSTHILAELDVEISRRVDSPKGTGFIAQQRYFDTLIARRASERDVKQQRYDAASAALNLLTEPERAEALRCGRIYQWGSEADRARQAREDELIPWARFGGH